MGFSSICLQKDSALKENGVWSHESPQQPVSTGWEAEEGAASSLPAWPCWGDHSQHKPAWISKQLPSPQLGYFWKQTLPSLGLIKESQNSSVWK